MRLTEKRILLDAIESSVLCQERQAARLRDLLATARKTVCPIRKRAATVEANELQDQLSRNASAMATIADRVCGGRGVPELRQFAVRARAAFIDATS